MKNTFKAHTIQRLLSIKLISQTPRNFQPLFPKTLHSLSKTNPLPHFFSHYATSSNSWWSQPNIPGKLIGFVSNSVLAKQLLPNALSKGQSKGLFNGGVGFAQFSRRYYYYYGGVEKPNILETTWARYKQWQQWISRMFTPREMLWGLIITNVAVFMSWRYADPEFMRKHFMVSLDSCRHMGMYTMITSGFSHADAGHLIFNMIGLYFFGSNIGRIFGPGVLLGLYLKGAFVGSAFFLMHQKYLEKSSKKKQMFGVGHSKDSAMGASGAVNAIMLLDMFLFPKSVVLFEFFIPVPAILLGVFIIGKDVWRIVEGDTEVSGAAHLGGATVAAWSWLRISRGRF